MRARRSAKGRLRRTCSWARRTLAAATRRMASVILRVFLTELIRSRMSLRFAIGYALPQTEASMVDFTSWMASLSMASASSLSCFSVCTLEMKSALLDFR